MILVFPEGAWRELLPNSVLECEDERARAEEWSLRARIYAYDHIYDDTVHEALWNVPKSVNHSSWGLNIQHTASPQETGAWGFDPVIKSEADLDKLTAPQVSVDEAASDAALAHAQERYGVLLDVRQRGVSHISFHLMNLYCQLRGLDQVMWDMYDDPAMLHRAMSILEAGNRGIIEQYQQLGLLELNNDNTYHSSGGNGWTNQLPAPGYSGEVRLADMWASAEAQEMAEVSPEMHAEFILAYEKRLLEPFGLTGYGCCEDLTNKLEDVLAIPNIRRISISPFADVVRCCEIIGPRAIVSWKPHPAQLVGTFDEAAVRANLQMAVKAACSNGCTLEMILKDTHTCENHPERFSMWSTIAQQVVNE